MTNPESKLVQSFIDMPRQTEAVQRDAHSRFNRTTGSVNASFAWGDILSIGGKALKGALQGAMS